MKYDEKNSKAGLLRQDVTGEMYTQGKTEHNVLVTFRIMTISKDNLV